MSVYSSFQDSNLHGEWIKGIFIEVETEGWPPRLCHCLVAKPFFN